ncbi:MAG: type II toxin-antitoxin system HigB family toxin [Chitinophagaceae bacterium]|nr:type II toxin-antitoxin system HigB family toxin [Chitinophagaceae bacterium]
MVVISYRTIREFISMFREAEDSLNNWYRIMTKADFHNYNELKSIFGSCDSVGNDRYVFNIKGNKYRVISLIQFSIRTVYILFVGTHAQYDKINASTIKFNRLR